MELKLLFLVLSCLVVSRSAPANLNSVENMRDVLHWLGIYGYYDGDKELIESLTHEELETAIQAPLKEMKALQKIYPIDGNVTEEVLETINAPRCGEKDVKHSRTKRYSIAGRYKWNRMPVTVSFTSFLPQFDNDTHERVLRDCLQMWSENSGIRFKYVKSSSAKIRIFHGHIDGKWNKIGLAIPARPNFYSYIKLETKELWRENYKSPGFGPSFKWTLCHELGHAISLGHSNDLQAIMYPKAGSGSRRKVELSQDDISAVRSLYGAPNNNTRNRTIEGFEHLPPAPPTTRSSTRKIAARPSNTFKSRRPNTPVVIRPSSKDLTGSVIIRTSNPDLYYRYVNGMLVMYYRGIPVAVRYPSGNRQTVAVPPTHPTTRSKINAQTTRTAVRTIIQARTTPTTRSTTHRRVTPTTRSTTWRRVTPRTRSITRRRVTPTTRFTTRRRVTPTTRSTTRRRVTPTTRSTTRRRVTPTTRSTTRRRVTPTTRPTTRRRVTPTTRSITRRRATQTTRSTIRRTTPTTRSASNKQGAQSMNTTQRSISERTTLTSDVSTPNKNVVSTERATTDMKHGIVRRILARRRNQGKVIYI